MASYTDPSGHAWPTQHGSKFGLLGYFMGSPGPSGFGSASTTEQVAASYDGTGKVVIITGASAGLGLESAKVLAKRGAHVVLAVRDMAKAQMRADKFKEEHPDAKMTLLPLDLTKLQSVREFVGKFQELKQPLNTLMLNAGIMATPLRMTSDGYESQFQTNHLSHFLLAELLTPELAKTAKSVPGSPKGRVVVLSSSAHYRPQPPATTGLPFATFDSPKDYNPFATYCRSKLCNVLMAREYNVRHANEAVEAVACHPGVIATELGRDLPKWITMLEPMFRPFLKSIPQGAATQVYCATTPVIKPGAFYADSNEQPASTLAADATLGAALWDWSIEHVGLESVDI